MADDKNTIEIGVSDDVGKTLLKFIIDKDGNRYVTADHVSAGKIEKHEEIHGLIVKGEEIIMLVHDTKQKKTRIIVCFQKTQEVDMSFTQRRLSNWVYNLIKQGVWMILCSTADESTYSKLNKCLANPAKYDGIDMTIARTITTAKSCYGYILEPNKTKMDYKEIASLIKTGNLEELKKHKVNNIPLLHLAVSVGNLRVVQYLINNGRDVNEKHKKGSTPIFCAAKKGRVDIFCYLIENGANINDYGKDLLHLSLRFNHPDITRIIIDKLTNNGKANLISEYYSKCIALSRIKYIKTLLEAGIDPNKYYGYHPAYYAVSSTKYHMRYDMLQLLIKRGLKVDVREPNIYSTIWSNKNPNNIDYYRKITKLLLKHGARFNLINILTTYEMNDINKKFIFTVMKYALPLADKNKIIKLYKFFNDLNVSHYELRGCIFYIYLRKLLKYGYSLENIYTFDKERIESGGFNTLLLLNRYKVNFNMLFSEYTIYNRLVRDKKDFYTIEFLLENGLDPTLVRSDTYRHFHISNDSESLEQIKKLLLHGVPLDEYIRRYFSSRLDKTRDLIMNWPVIVPLTVLCIRCVFRNRVDTTDFPQTLLELTD